MRQSEKVGLTLNNSKGTTKHTNSAQSTSFDKLTKNQLVELLKNSANFICRVENFMYLCIGKNDIRGYCYYSEVPANIPCMSFLPKIGGLASFYTYIN